MKSPQAYLDVRVAASEQMPRLLHVLHGMSRRQPGRFALAFPRMAMGTGRRLGDTVRLFTDHTDQADALATELRNLDALSFRPIISHPKTVPEDFNGPWKEYRRVRVPGNSSRLEKCREYRLNAVELLPHFRIFSKSTGQPFVVFIEERPGNPSPACDPDSYGLSLPSRAFSLPDLP